METLQQDIRYGLRMLIKNRSFTAIAVLALALGIGANTAIFSVVNAVILRPLAFQEPDKLVRVEEHHEAWARAAGLTFATYIDTAARCRSLQNLSAYRTWNFNLTDEGEPEQASGSLVTANFFAALGVQPVLGRTFHGDEDRPGSAKVAVISHGLWQRRFGAALDAMGKTIKVNGESHTIIGVMPRGFLFPEQSDLWTPLVTDSLKNNRRAHLLRVIGRLQPGATVEQARSELASIAAQIEEQNRGIDPDLQFNLIGLHEQLIAPVRPALFVLLGAVGFVLLIACTNVANLLLARNAAREKEMAIRAALGAGQLRLVRQLLTESLMLALLGGLLGFLFARWGVSLMVAFSPRSIPRLDEVRIDGRVLLFTFAASLLTGLLFGLVPALQSSKVNLNSSLKEGARSSSGAGRHRLRRFLVVAEIALALVLLIGAGLLINSFKRLLDVDPGFNPKNVLTMQLFQPGSQDGTDEKKTAFLNQALERIRTIPGVAAAGLANCLPITGGPNTDFEIVGRPVPDANDEPSADIRVIDPDYFRAMEIPLRQGRWFTERDTATAPKVMVINETMARRFWPNEDPLGKRVTMKDWGDPLTGEIVGVVGDVKANGLDTQTNPMIYWPHTQFPTGFNRIIIRTVNDPSSVIAAVKQQVWSVNKEQPLADIKSMEQVLATSVAERRFNMALLGGFAVIALLLAAVGIYGVMAYTVTQRTREIGIRMALGAERRDIIKLVMRQGVTLAVLGIGTGLIGALALTRLLSSLLFGISATDPITFIVISLTLTGVALGACLIPARRATKVDPMIALRYE